MLLLRKTVYFPLITFQTQLISDRNCIKFLGIIIAKHPTSEEHIKNISSKLSKSVGIVYELNHMLPVPDLKLLYYASIYIYINYGIESQFGAPEYASNGVWVLNKKSCPSNLFFRLLGSQCQLVQVKKNLTIFIIYKLNLCCHLFKSLQKK